MFDFTINIVRLHETSLSLSLSFLGYKSSFRKIFILAYNIYIQQKTEKIDEALIKGIQVWQVSVKEMDQLLATEMYFLRSADTCRMDKVKT
jgi:hypothetical protein